MSRLQWSRPAVADLGDIRAYIDEHNPRAAAGLAQILLDATQQIRRHPGSGRPGRVPGTRELVISGTPFVVAYRVRDEVVEILRVLHGARRWPTRL